MVDEAGITKLYVKGATDHAQTERAAALSW